MSGHPSDRWRSCKILTERHREKFDDSGLFPDVGEIDACFDMMWVIVGYMMSRGWKCSRIWDEGALSNLRKIDIETKKVLKREDGKVLKPEGWQPPDFTKFVK